MHRLRCRRKIYIDNFVQNSSHKVILDKIRDRVGVNDNIAINNFPTQEEINSHLYEEGTAILRSHFINLRKNKTNMVKKLIEYYYPLFFVSNNKDAGLLEEGDLAYNMVATLIVHYYPNIDDTEICTLVIDVLYQMYLPCPHIYTNKLFINLSSILFYTPICILFLK